jgi:cyclic beta-1,2-glucan synthetase
LLGLYRRGETFTIDPCIPATWPSYEIVWRFSSARYEISVLNPNHRCRGVGKATLDGKAVDFRAIPLMDDGQVHEVRVELGESK